MFDRIAPVYDSMNRVMTAGLDVRWRRLAAAAVVRPGDRVLDAACGTGDLAIADLRAGAAAVTGLDFSPRCSSARAASRRRVDWVEGDLLALPFEDGAFDAATVGFGVRNLARPRARRCASCTACCAPAAGSRSSRSRTPRGPLRPFFALWFDRVVPVVGKALPGGARTRTCPRR